VLFLPLSSDHYDVKLLSLLIVARLAAQAQTNESIEKQRASIAIQRAAIRKQRETAIPAPSLDLSPDDSPAPPPDSGCGPLPEPELTPLIDSAAKTHSIQPQLLRAVIETESATRPCAVSPKGAAGLMQLMPATIDQFDVDDPFDPKQNVEAGAQFLKELLDRYKGDLSLVLAAFNAGPATVDRAKGIPDIKETKDYVETILKKMQPKD
jgi:soluble lytic murein transglycosylase-like protein